ncbi:MAG TPA: site-2 protease family protein [Terriglobia bacterium]|jgi:Zn-dependent protease|nr:site-2 protease family protein [Terriglobia bacterium]
MHPDTLALGLLWYIAFLFSLCCHESSHALAARLGGDPTAFLAGQMTLNPVPHIRREPFGTVLVPIASYLLAGWMIGWASAPYNPAWQRQYPRRAGWMALAGPAANFTLVIVAAAGIHLGLALGAFVPPGRVSFTSVVGAASPDSIGGALAALLSILFSLNLLLGTFNLLPVPPLDGITAIGVLLPESLARRLADVGRNRTLALVGLLIAWKAFDYLFRPVFIAALNLLYPGSGYG